MYTAVFEKVFKQFTVQYEFKSLTADKELPEEVTALLPKDPAGYGRDTDIKAIAPAKTEVKVDGGTWTFKGFDKDSKKSRDGKCHRRHGNAPLHHCGRGPREAGRRPVGLADPTTWYPATKNQRLARSQAPTGSAGFPRRGLLPHPR